MLKLEASRSKDKHFALYVLQIISFLGVVKYEKRNDAKRDPTNYQNRRLWGYRVGLLRFWSVLAKGELLMNYDWQIVGPPNQTNQSNSSAGTSGTRRRKSRRGQGGGSGKANLSLGLEGYKNQMFRKKEVLEDLKK